MPQEWNNILVVTADELLPFYKSMANLQKAILRDKNKPSGLRKLQSGGNGRQLLVSFDSLPIEVQNTLGDPRKLSHFMELFFRWESEPARFFHNFRFDDGTYLSSTHQDQYNTNACVLIALLKLKKARIAERTSKGGSLKGLTKSLLQDVTSFNDVLFQKYQVRHNLPNSEKRFKQALSAFESKGLASIVSKRHRNDNAKKVDDETMALLNSLFAKQLHKPTRTEVAKQYDAFLAGYIEIINNSTGELYNPSDFKKLTDTTIIAWLGKWQHRIGTYTARGGNRQKLITQFRPYHSMEQPKYAGSIISIDDRQPPFTYGNNQRVWFYNGIDLASECFTCFVAGKTKEGIILDFYRDMVRRYHGYGVNIPHEVEAEMSLNSNLLGTLLREGNMFSKVRIEANNARGKRIEGYYRPLRYELEKQEIGWLARPFAISESNQAGPSAPVELPYESIVKQGLKHIATWNNMPHSKHPSMSRWDYFMANQNPNLEPTNYKGILPYIGYKTTSSCNAGGIRLQGARYLLGDNGVLATGDALVSLMSRIEDATVTIYWLDDLKGEIIKALVYLGDTYICEAIPEPSYNRASIEQTPKDLENRTLMSSYVSTIDAYMKHQRQQLENLVVIDNRVVTLNNNFVIPELAGEPAYDQAVQLPSLAPTEDIDDLAYTSVKDLKDRF